MGLLSLLFGAVLRDEAERGKAAARQGAGGGYRHPIEDANKPPLDPNFEQIAGERCKTCKSTIVTKKDGKHCDACKKPIHHDCMARHASKCGAPTDPYR